MKKGFAWLLGIYLCVLLGAAIIAGIAFDVIQQISRKTSIECVQYLASKPLAQYVDRLRLVGFFLIAIPFICKRLHLTKEQLQLRFNGTAYLIGFCRGCLLWCCLFGFIAYQLKNITLTHQPASLIGIFIASFFIAILEEIIFRGVCFAVIRKKHSFNHSIMLLGLLFACLHFSSCTEIISDNNSIVRAIQSAIGSLTNIISTIQWPYFCCLFLLSGILMRFRLIYRSLWISIGFHQGLVFTLMLIRKRCVFDAICNNFWGTGRLTDAWAVVLILFIINLLMRRYISSHEKTF